MGAGYNVARPGCSGAVSPGEGGRGREQLRGDLRIQAVGRQATVPDTHNSTSVRARGHTAQLGFAYRKQGWTPFQRRAINLASMDESC